MFDHKNFEDWDASIHGVTSEYCIGKMNVGAFIEFSIKISQIDTKIKE